MGFEYLTNIPLAKAREDYLNLLVSHGYGPKTEVIPVWDACGRVTAHAVYAHICAPHYAASAMDGVAVNAKDTFRATETTPVALKPGQFIVLDTGDPIPEGCDAVIMVEDIVKNEDGSIQKILCTADHAVVLQQHDIAAGSEAFADILAQLVTAGNGINCDPQIVANLPHRGDQVHIRQLAYDREGNQCRGMGMKHCSQIGTHFIDRRMEGQLRRRSMGADAGAVGLDADNVTTVQGALIHTGGGDPDIAVAVLDGQVAAGGGGHTLVVNTLHKHDQLVSRMDIINIHEKLL